MLTLTKVTETASFTTDLNADSLDTVELIMDFEKEFGITIPDEEAQNIKTVSDAIAFVEKGRQVICRHSNSNTEAAANNPAVFVYISPFQSASNCTQTNKPINGT